MTTASPRLVWVASTPMTVHAFLRGHLAALARVADVHVVSSFGRDRPLPLPGGVTAHSIPIKRPVSPWADARALAALTGKLRSLRPDLVHSVTPKAGLLAMTGARLAGVPRRVHWFTGQVWATRTGSARLMLRWSDRYLARQATHVLADSRSQLQFLRDEGVLKATDGAVLADGSISGVDVSRFRPDERARAAVRGELGIPEDAIVFVFLGRLQPDKGLIDLGAAFARVAAIEPRARLLVIGPDEACVAAQLEAAVGDRRDQLHRVDFTPEPERLLVSGDVFCLPSYREGFGTSVIEAAACGLPAVVSRIYGLTDAVIDGETGLLHPPHDVQAIAGAMARLAAAPALRARLGEAARARAQAAFSSERVTAALLDWYRAIGVDLRAAGPDPC